MAMHEAMGFTTAGVWRQCGYKLGRWWDVGVWQKELQIRRCNTATGICSAISRNCSESRGRLCSDLLARQRSRGVRKKPRHPTGAGCIWSDSLPNQFVDSMMQQDVRNDASGDRYWPPTGHHQMRTVIAAYGWRR